MMKTAGGIFKTLLSQYLCSNVMNNRKEDADVSFKHGIYISLVLTR
jgi:hypothetical protein